MEKTEPVSQISNKKDQLAAKVSAIRELTNRLQEGARIDMEPKVERVETMLAALERDVTESATPGGADQATTASLADQLERETEDLLREVQALSTGNPTTVSAALDTISKAIPGQR
ncbi:MAG: hypothetical protein MI807_00260 [Verrucomicrobiales bacterium]|nr:hypothetical protein [Verrucomicrobiales bacterium]